MVSYNNGNVVQCLRQYDMFANSLNLVKTRDERAMVIKQLTKLESKIIDLTNEIYEEEYRALANKETGLIDEEKVRLMTIIDLINQRLSYVEKRCNNHYQLTGESINVSDVLGTSSLDALEERVKIIDKYSKNLKLSDELQEEVKSLANKISLASEKVDINKSLNQELEKKFCDLLTKAFDKLGLNNLLDEKDEIEYNYFETEKSLKLAELNYEASKTSPLNVLSDCQQMLNDIKIDYNKYKDKMCLLKIFEEYKREVFNYEDLLAKRKIINDLIKYVNNQGFINLVLNEVNNQYNTIMMEQQDINTLEDLTSEKNRKLEALAEIEEENNSDKFQTILGELIENERKRQALILEKQRKIEEEERQKRLEIEKKKQEEMLKRQKIIEEARKKEIEKRTKELLEQQQKSVLQSKKATDFSFETMKNISNNNKTTDDISEHVEDIIDRESIEEFEKEDDLIDNNPIIFKNKVDIEKELFEEFNGKDEEQNQVEDNVLTSLNFDDDTAHESLEIPIVENSVLPEKSIDEYMKNYDNNNENKLDTLFKDDDLFPSIPV